MNLLKGAMKEVNKTVAGVKTGNMTLTQAAGGMLGTVLSTGASAMGGGASRNVGPSQDQVDAVNREMIGPPPPNTIIPDTAPGTTVTQPVVPGPGQQGSPFAKVSYGPFLRYGGFDPATGKFRASALVVSYQGQGGHPPIIHIKDGHSTRQVNAEHLDHFANYNFWRFDLDFDLGPVERRIEYCVMHAQDPFYQQYQPRWIHWTLPPAHTTWNWGFYSCNGFHDARDKINLQGIQPLWNDVMTCHTHRPLHIMVGGGDQLYNDPVLELPILELWYKTHDKVQKTHSPYPPDMANAVKWYYLHSYMRHWSEPGFGDALSCIPQVMMWDDHDIFDGWGSYKPVLQNCQVFQGIFESARRFFALFQQHSTVVKIHHHNQVFGERGWNWVNLIGPDTAVVVPDTRTERTRLQIVTPTSWEMIQHRIEALPSGVRHVVVVATVPVVYPTMETVDAMMRGLSCKSVKSWMKPMLASFNADHHLFSKMGDAELMDDLIDHWGNKDHEHEKKWLVQMMQGLAQRRGFRFSLLSGDVHVAAVSKLRSQPEIMDIRKDHRFVLQVTSSGIGNTPPPGAVASLLNMHAKDKALTPDTYEVFLKTFNNANSQATGKEFVRTARNWCLVTPGTSGALSFQLRMEDPAARRHTGEVYNLEAPPLDVPGVAPGGSAHFAPIPLPPGPPAHAPSDIQYHSQPPEFNGHQSFGHGHGHAHSAYAPVGGAYGADHPYPPPQQHSGGGVGAASQRVLHHGSGGGASGHYPPGPGGASGHFTGDYSGAPAYGGAPAPGAPSPAPAYGAPPSTLPTVPSMNSSGAYPPQYGAGPAAAPPGGAPYPGYAAPPGGGYYPPAPGGGYPPAPGGGYPAPPGGGYPAAPESGYAAPPGGGYAAPPGGGYAAPPGGGYAAPPAAGGAYPSI